MLMIKRYRLSFLLFLAVLPLTGCLFRSRPVDHPLATTPLKTATKEELVDYVNSQAAKIKSMQATVDIDTTVGGAKQGKVTDYQQIRGYVLARKPAMLRMIGLVPIVRNRAFDMVSDGKEFKLWIPPKNRFVEGRNDLETPNAKQPLENLRPQHIYDALLLREIDPKTDIAFLESGVETIKDRKGHIVEQPDYEINVVRKGDQGWYLARKIVFSRVDLLPHRQIVYDEFGNQATDSTYEGYQAYDGMNFPSQIRIKRPQEEYDITLTIVKLQLNEPLPDDKFVLEQPAGADVIHLNQNRPQDNSRAEARAQSGKR
jgi:outer membrane lipoprotein-sorting protein